MKTLLLISLAMVSALTLRAQTYTVTDLGSGFFPTAINNKGEVVGDSLSTSHAFLYTKGKLRDLGTLDGSPTSSEANAINDMGEVVGNSGIAKDLANHSFLFKGVKMLPIPTDGEFSYAINDRGEIAGAGSTQAKYGGEFGFLYTFGRTLDLTFPGGNMSEAYSINNAGQVVGTSNTASGAVYAFIFSNGRMQNIGNFNPTHINDHGQVVGQVAVGVGRNQTHHACLYVAGHLTDIGVLPGTVISWATGINNSGEIIGFCASNPKSEILIPFVYKGGQMHGLTAVTPVGWKIGEIYAINDAGEIAGIMEGPNEEIEAHGVLLTPKLR